MQIQLKQAEIEAALKMFIAAQGINVEGKTVGITFIAGRKAGGLVADVSINDVTIPGYTDTSALEDAQAAPVPALAVVKSIAPVAVETVAPEAVVAEDPPFDVAATAEPEAAEAAPAVKPVTSLFS